MTLPGGQDSTDARADRLVGEIDRARADVAETLQEIGARLEPGNVVREARDAVTHATQGKVEQMAIGARETWDDVMRGDAPSIIDTVRSNPVPAGMVALGLGLLFMRRGSGANRTSWRREDEHGGHRGYGGYGTRYGYGYDDRAYGREGSRESVTSRVGLAVGEAGEQAGRMAGEAGATVGRVADETTETLGRMASEAGETVGRVAERLGETVGEVPLRAGEFVDTGTSHVRRLIDENPLVVGVVAVAAGAAAGMLMPTTGMERRTIGPVRDRFVDRAESAAEETLERVESTETASASRSGPAGTGAGSVGSTSLGSTESTGSTGSTGSVTGDEGTSGL